MDNNLTISPLWGNAFMSISSLIIVLYSNIMPLVFKKLEDKMNTLPDFEDFDELFFACYYCIN